MSRLSLQLHGDALVQRADGPPLPLRGRAAALVALAALEPGVPRERVAALLWPDAPNPRQNLRQQLLRFKQALGSSLVEGEERLQLAADVTLEQPRPGAELLAGEPLVEGDFGAWLQQQRDAARRAERSARTEALARAEQDGDLDRALKLALEGLARAPDDEWAAAALMRTHYLRGEAAAGLAVHRELVQRLLTSEGRAPSATTRALADDLQRAAPLPPSQSLTARTAPAALPVTLRRPPQRVGRAAEWAAMQAGWAQGQVLLLDGEAGLGKSRLLSDWLALHGPALAGAGRPGDTGAPYTTLARWLQPLLAGGVAALSPASRQALQHLGPSAVEHALRPDALAAAVTELMDRDELATLALDDLHFADDATLDLVAALACAAHPHRRWLLAQRPAETGSAARRLLDQLAEDQRLHHVRLQPLDEAATAALVDDLGLHGLSGAALAGTLVQHTGGNPLFLLETLKQGLVDGSLARGELPRPAGVGALIERRLQRLGEAALALARVAAIAGVDFSIELAEVAIGQQAVQLATAWQELQDAQVLRDEAFAHDLVADAVLRGVPQVVARRVHGQCAAWLAAHGGEPARVARHWRAAGRAAEAAAAFLQAASRALVASRRHEEAALLADAAQAHAEAGQWLERFNALATRVEALTAAVMDERALQEAAALEADAADDAQRLRAISVHVGLLTQLGHAQQAQEIGLRGLAMAQRLGLHAEHVQLAGSMAGNYSKLGQPEQAYSLLLPLREWVDSHAPDDLRSLWYGYWAATLGHLGRLREAVACFEVCIAAIERVGRRDATGAAVVNLGVVLRAMGRLAAAFEVSQRALSLMSDDPQATSSRTLARLTHARDQAETGRFADALQAFEDLGPRLQAMGGGFWTVAMQTTWATMWLHLGQFARAQQALAGHDDSATPAFMRSSRQLLHMEIANWLGRPVPQTMVADAQAMVAADPGRIAGAAVRALRAATPDQVLAEVPTWIDRSLAQERYGVALAARVHETRAALQLGQLDRAASAARAALALVAQGYAPDAMYGPEVQLVAWRALSAVGAADEARQALFAGADWVRQQALPQVPPAFIDAFLHRNPVNRDLLAAAAQLR